MRLWLQLLMHPRNLLLFLLLFFAECLSIQIENSVPIHQHITSSHFWYKLSRQIRLIVIRWKVAPWWMDLALRNDTRRRPGCHWSEKWDNKVYSLLELSCKQCGYLQLGEVCFLGCIYFLRLNTSTVFEINRNFTVIWKEDQLWIFVYTSVLFWFSFSLLSVLPSNNLQDPHFVFGNRTSGFGPKDQTKRC